MSTWFSKPWSKCFCLKVCGECHMYRAVRGSENSREEEDPRWSLAEEKRSLHLLSVCPTYGHFTWGQGYHSFILCLIRKIFEHSRENRLEPPSNRKEYMRPNYHFPRVLLQKKQRGNCPHLQIIFQHSLE